MKIRNVVVSNDNTKKYYFTLSETCDSHVEACLLYLERYGHIICVSSQMGCSQKCKFCAAGSSEFIRNLTSQEIQEQVNMIIDDNPKMKNEEFQVTYMGSGEPLNNYKNVFDSIDKLQEMYSNLKKVNVSTTCPTNSLNCFKEIEWEKYIDFLHLQYSLHFTTDEQRREFLGAKLLTITESIEQLNRIACIIHDTYKLNYILFDGVNDSEKHIEELARILNMTNGAVVKISQMCEVNNSKLAPSKRFGEIVDYAKNIIKEVEAFRSDGTDVNAGCGQFYNESIV